MADLEDVVEPGELAFELLESRRSGDQEEHAAGGAVADGNAGEGVEIESAAGEEAGDVRERARVIAHAELEDDGRRAGGIVT